MEQGRKCVVVGSIPILESIHIYYFHALITRKAGRSSSTQHTTPHEFDESEERKCPIGERCVLTLGSQATFSYAKWIQHK